MTTQTPPNTGATLEQAKSFYDREFSGERYMAPLEDKWPAVRQFVNDYGLADNAKCIEIGCGRGEHQDHARDYTGTDISATVEQFIKPGKKFKQCSATEIPFEDSTFDAAWTVWVIEHVPGPEKALEEIRRVLKPGGLLFLAPAWQCRSWAAEGYPVRPYSDFGLKGKLIKASVPLRNWIVWRAAFVFPKRFLRLIETTLNKGPTRFRYRTLEPNFEKYWMPDSDAINNMDPYEAITWFRSRGDEVLQPSTPLKQFFMRTGPLIIRIRK